MGAWGICVNHKFCSLQAVQAETTRSSPSDELSFTKACDDEVAAIMGCSQVRVASDSMGLALHLKASDCDRIHPPLHRPVVLAA